MERAVNNAHRGRQTRDGIRIYEPSDHAGMQAAGRLAATILDEIAEHVFPGQTTGELDRLIEEKVNAAGAKSATEVQQTTKPHTAPPHTAPPGHGRAQTQHPPFSLGDQPPVHPCIFPLHNY